MIVLFREVAEEELLAAWSWYAAVDAAPATRFVARVEAAMASAARNPEAYQRIEGDIRHVRLRGFPHALYFRVVGEAIVVVAVFHLSRSPSKLKGRA